MNSEMLTPLRSADDNPALEFRDGQCLFRMTSLAGTKSERLVSWATVREAATGIPVDSGWLPAEVVRWGTGSLSSGDWVVAWMAPSMRTIELTVEEAGQQEKLE